MKKAIVLILVLSLFLSMMPASAIAAELQDTKTGSSFAGGNGTTSNPYQVSNAKQLDAVRNDLSAHYIQTADINLSGMEWKPIGAVSFTGDEKGFSGTYDGNGFEIANLTITTIDSSSVYVGLFGYNNGGVLNNITLRDVHIELTITATTFDSGDEGWYHNPFYGTIAGASKGSIDNCYVSGSIKVFSNVSVQSADADVPDVYVGGIVGEGTCTNSENHADIYASGDYQPGDWALEVVCGGITGSPRTINGEIRNCVNYGDVFASADGFALAGGISGKNGSIQYCVNRGNISSNSTAFEQFTSGMYQSNAGGIVGVTSARKISHCVNFGDVFATKSCEDSGCTAGGIVGFYGSSESAGLEKCYNLGGHIHADITCPEDPHDPELEESTTYVGAIYGDYYYGWNDGERAKNAFTVDTVILSNINVDTVIGFNGTELSEQDINAQIADILEVAGMPEKDNSGGGETPGEQNPEGGATQPNPLTGSVRFFSRWDAENQIAYFGEFDFLGCKLTEKTDTSFLANVDSLIGQYVWVESEPVGNGIVDSDLLLCIKPVEVRTGTVSYADASTIIIDGATYSTPACVTLPDLFVGEGVRYYLSGNELLGLELLSENGNEDKPADGNKPSDGTQPDSGDNNQNDGDSNQGGTNGGDGNTAPDPTNPTDGPNETPESPYNSLQEKWIEQHLDYADSDDFKKEIVNGFSGELLSTLRDGLKDNDVNLYQFQNYLLQILQLDFEITNEEAYELILAELFYGQSEIAFHKSFAENLERTVWENTEIVYSVINTANNISDIKPDELKKINALYAKMITVKFGTKEFASVFKEFCGSIQDKIKLSTIISDVLPEVLTESAITFVLEEYNAFEDIMWYAAYCEASQKMAQQTKDVLYLLAYYVSQATNTGLPPDDVFKELGLYKSVINWTSLKAAIVSFIESLHEFETNANAVADYAVQRHNEVKDMVLDSIFESASEYALDTALMYVPVVNKIVMAKKAVEAAITASIILTRVFTDIDDKTNNLELMTVNFTLSTALYFVVSHCKGAMSSEDFYQTTVFDKAVSIYRENAMMALNYASSYTTLVLAEKTSELRKHDKESYLPPALDYIRQRLIKSIQEFNNRITSLNQQMIDTHHILCHDNDMSYDFVNDEIIYNPRDTRIFVVACPVDVLVFNEAGKQIARLNGATNTIMEGYELMFKTALIPDSNNDYIKVAIVPEGYTVKLEGTGEGVMNAFTALVSTDITGEVAAYFDIPVHAGSVGQFELSSGAMPSIVLDEQTYQNMADEAGSDSTPSSAWIVLAVCIVAVAAVVVLLIALQKKRAKKRK